VVCKRGQIWNLAPFTHVKREAEGHMNSESNSRRLFPARPSLWRDVLWITSIALIYFAAARLSLSLVFQPEGIAAVWPPSGIFLSAMLLTRRDLRPWLAGVICITDFTAEMLTGTPWVVSLIYALALTGDAVFSLWLLMRFVGENITFTRVREVVGWLLLSVILSNFLVSLGAGAASQLLPGTSFWSSWKEWAASDAIGNLLFTPFILSWAAWGRIRLDVWNPKRVLEGAALFILMALLNYIAFTQLSEHGQFSLFLTYLTFPFLMWAALRFGVRGAASASVILAGIAVYFASIRHVTDVFLTVSPLDIVITVQLYLVVLAVPALFLAVVVTERLKADAARLASEKIFRTLFEQANDGMLLADIETKRFILANRQILQMLNYSEDELLQLSVADLHPAADLPAVHEQFEKQARGEITLAPDIPVKRKDGTMLYADISSVVIRVHQRDCLLGIFRDVTKSKWAEEQIKSQLNELRRWHDVMMDREDRVLELKNEVNELLAQAGHPPLYKSVAEEREK
jgi:PAS domain S-box-containing protein